MSREAQESVKHNSKAKGSARAVLNALADHHNNTTGQCFPSETLIAKETGYTVRTVIRALQRLETLWEITIVRFAKGRASAYLIRLPGVTPCPEYRAKLKASNNKQLSDKLSSVAVQNEVTSCPLQVTTTRSQVTTRPIQVTNCQSNLNDLNKPKESLAAVAAGSRSPAAARGSRGEPSTRSPERDRAWLDKLGKRLGRPPSTSDTKSKVSLLTPEEFDRKANSLGLHPQTLETDKAMRARLDRLASAHASGQQPREIDYDPRWHPDEEGE